ncbi:MAG: hypothetical protein KF721_11975 [Ignavibacteriaceae bacterium]|nr:hypothetical protein [Ignavibacteriaceae bacterium]
MKIYILVYCLIHFSRINFCQLKEFTELSAKLPGVWIAEFSHHSIIEKWSIDFGENELYGESFKIQNLNTTKIETIRLLEIENKIQYIPRVFNQNQGREIIFHLNKSEDDFVFVNRDHDFPQVIKYSFNASDSLSVEISNIERSKRFNFKFVKVK